MSWDYVEKKIREAMHLHRGNSTRVRQQIITWAMDDPKLLQTLVKPHMTGITAHAVGRVKSGKTRPEPVAQEPPLRATRGVPPKKAQPRKPENDSFGMDILKTIAGGKTAEFGQEDYGFPQKRQGVSQSHIDAILAMTKKSSD